MSEHPQAAMRFEQKPPAIQDDDAVVADNRNWLERAVAAFPDSSAMFERNDPAPARP